MNIDAKERARAQRNLNPTPEAVFAMFHWSADYARQNGGSMDYYDSLPQPRQEFCKRSVDGILQAAEKHRQAHVKTKRT